MADWLAQAERAKVTRAEALASNWTRLEIDTILEEVRDELFPKSQITSLLDARGCITKGIHHKTMALVGNTLIDFQISLSKSHVAFARKDLAGLILSEGILLDEIPDANVLRETIGRWLAENM